MNFSEAQSPVENSFRAPMVSLFGTCLSKRTKQEVFYEGIYWGIILQLYCLHKSIVVRRRDAVNEMRYIFSHGERQPAKNNVLIMNTIPRKNAANARKYVREFIILLLRGRHVRGDQNNLRFSSIKIFLFLHIFLCLINICIYLFYLLRKYHSYMFCVFGAFINLYTMCVQI